MTSRREKAAKSLNAFFGNGPASDLSPAIRGALANLDALAESREPMKPGAYLYTDPIGGPAQRIEVVKDGDELVARFPAVEGDEEGADLPVTDLSGSFERVE